MYSYYYTLQNIQIISLRLINLRFLCLGGYYSAISKKHPNLQIVVLNTNLWHASNKAINGTLEYDPAGQFQFLTNVLERAVADDMKVRNSNLCRLPNAKTIPY